MNNIVSSPAFNGYFNEKKFIDAIMAFAKLRNSLNSISHYLMYQLPSSAGPWASPSDYHLTAFCLEHILRRHYAPFKPSQPTSKFTIPLPQITDLIMQAYSLPAEPVVKVSHYVRLLDAGRIIRHDQNGQDSTFVKIVVENNNWVKTAYPIADPFINS